MMQEVHSQQNGEVLQLGDGRVGWRLDQELIDALPYVDEITSEEKVKAEQLIQEEMIRSRKRKKDFVDSLPPVKKLKFEKCPMILQELRRLSQKQGMPKLDMSRYNMEPPPPTRQWETQAWQNAVNNANSQLEHQYNRISNLELLQKHGANAWRAQVGVAKVQVDLLQKEVDMKKKDIDAINRERKLSQIEGGRELKVLEDEQKEQLAKNCQMQVALLELQWEIEDLKRQCEEKGINWEPEQERPQLPPLPGEEQEVIIDQQEKRLLSNDQENTIIGVSLGES
eukprot:TRINITY_DN10267_c0_g1_i1.p2 TRINITY_DN10267_c0_g1~~TRINITY_DN10267_c0_g1_i1.p2  ORF type:complete len:283 (-),score=53.52 TRINITY_DN10267_c0_g1_i1:216-1064(-)